MKSYLCTLLLGLFCACMPLQAQIEDDGETHASKIDSLNDVINSLNQKIENDKENARMEKIWKRKKYRYIGYVMQSLTHLDEENLRWKSEFGVDYGMGRTYFLHKHPLGKVVKFGIDWTMMDMNYAKLKENYRINTIPSPAPATAATSGGFDDIQTPENPDMPDIKLGCHAIDLGMQVGPSIWINPVDHLMLNGYFRYAPTAAMLVIDDEFSIGYGSFFVTGGAISYKTISFGVETRWGKTKYNSFEIDEEGMDNVGEEGGSNSVSGLLNSSKNKMKMKSTRFYICFRL